MLRRIKDQVRAEQLKELKEKIVVMGQKRRFKELRRRNKREEYDNSSAETTYFVEQYGITPNNSMGTFKSRIQQQ